jgi:UDP-glucose 4-epimerase
VANVGWPTTHGLLPDLLRKVRSDESELSLLGDFPGSAKPYVHARDTADFLEKLAHTDLTGTLNLGSDDQLSVCEVAELVMNKLGRRKPTVWLGEQANWPGDNRFVNLDSHKAFALGWRPRGSERAVLEAIEENL